MKTTAETVVQTNLFLEDLPIELQDRIIIEFARDPDTTFDELKSLRLVCQTFNALCSPRVLSCIHLFRHADDVLANMRQLHALLPSRRRDHLSYPRMLLIENWRWIYGANHFMSFREMRNTGLWVPGLILNSTLLPLLYFLGFLFAPQILPLSLFNTVVRLRARHRLAKTCRLDIPNIRRVEWIAEKDDPNWTTIRTVKLLLEFPQLTELSLTIDDGQDLGHFANCLSRLTNLRKFRLDIRRLPGKIFRPQDLEIDNFGKVLAKNPMLTHLDLFQECCARGSLSRMFSHIPEDCPLKLEHLGISDNFRDGEAILPHIRSLKSIYVRSRWSSNIFMVLLHEHIFPPIIRTARVDNQFIDFISSHPGITRLSVHNVYDEVAANIVLETMARHGESLEYFSTYASSLCRCLGQVQNEFLLLKCTKLRELVLRYDQFFYYLETNISVPSEMETALSIISRLHQSLALVITSMMGFKACVSYCQRSSNPMVRNLAGRIVYEKVSGTHSPE